MKAQKFGNRLDRSGSWLSVWFSDQGQELVEFAIVLPFVVVIVLGILEFGAVWNLKQKVSNAAREGARIAASQSTADLTQSSPPSLSAVGDVVVNYLTNANVTTCTINSTPNATGQPLTWTYSATGPGCTAPVLKVERGYTTVLNGTTIVMTRVTLSYPYNWITFNSAISLLGSASWSSTITLTSAAVSQNLI
jgi:Flp pilus assembly protein TadG